MKFAEVNTSSENEPKVSALYIKRNLSYEREKNGGLNDN